MSSEKHMAGQYINSYFSGYTIHTSIVMHWLMIFTPDMCLLFSFRNNHTPTYTVHLTHTLAYCSHWRQGIWQGCILPALLSKVAVKFLRSLHSDMFGWPDRNSLIRKEKTQHTERAEPSVWGNTQGCQVRRKQYKLLILQPCYMFELNTSICDAYMLSHAINIKYCTKISLMTTCVR